MFRTARTSWGRGLIALAVIIFCSLGCVAVGMSPTYALRIKNVDWPLQPLQQFVAGQVPAGLRTTSSNGREFYSRYFVLDKNSYKPAGEALDRFTAVVTVLGDSRPYDLEIYVIHEKRVLRGQNFDYVTTGHDMDLADEVKTKISAQLTKRREDRNIIDDFRVF